MNIANFEIQAALVSALKLTTKLVKFYTAAIL